MKPRFVVIGLILTLLLAPALVSAQEPAAVTLSVEAGLDSYYRVGQWLPVRVLLKNDGPAIDGRVEVVLQRPDNGAVTYQYPVNLPTQSRKEIALYLSPQEYINRLQITLLSQTGQTIVQQEQPMKALNLDDRLYGILADQPSAFNVLQEIDPPNGAAVTAQLTIRDLPDRAVALDMLDTLIISNVDTGALSESQRTALAAWIANGGRLIVAGGAGWQKTVAGLRDLLPVQPATTTTLNAEIALRAFANSAADPGSLVVTTSSLTPDAQALVLQDTTPLIARRPQGLGEVYFFGFDPAALTQWEGLAGTFRQIVEAEVKKPNWAHGVQGWDSAYNAASMIPNLSLPPASLICGFVILYMVVIGPVNYFIVRALKRRELAWVSAPLLAVGFLLGAFLIGTLMRGSEPVINRLALVQVWPNTERARVTGLVGLYAPQRAAYEVKAEQGLLLHPPFDNRPYRSDNSSTWTLRSDADTQHARVDMDVSEVKTLSVEGDITAPPFEVETQIVVDGRGARAAGSVTNHSDLTLQNAVLLGPSQARDIGTIKPGDRVSVDFELEHAAQAGTADTTSAPYYQYNDKTVEDIVGPYYYGNTDRTRARRYELLNALLHGYNSSYQPRGDGLYLVGWSEQSPLAVDVDSPSFGAYNTTLYIIDLKPALRVMSGTLTLPPGMFTWKSVNPSGPPIAPYNADVYPGTHLVQFNLARPIAFAAVQNLVLHLEGSVINQNALTLALWNPRTKNWIPLPSPTAGDNPIADPAQYVGPGGEIRVQLEAKSNSYLHLDRLDFTLTVR